MNNTSQSQKEKLLFTPGPLSTSPTVKEAMLVDLGSRADDFIDTIKELRSKLLELGQVKKGEYEAILLQGSGTFCVESVLTSTIPKDGKILLVINGAYGRRMTQICDIAGIENVPLIFPENQHPTLDGIQQAIQSHKDLTHLAVVHSETTTGIINPIEDIGKLAHQHGLNYVVDAMSSFGGVPIDLKAAHIDYLISSANKCLGGVPGFGFILAKHDTFMATEGYARSLSLDLFAQWKGLETNGQFRFTPPTHTMLALKQAIHELEAEGGVEARCKRFQNNHRVLLEGMKALGFKTYLSDELQGHIITSFYYPESEDFNFDSFYNALDERSFVIYPGKVSDAACFRIGHIGHLFEEDIQGLLQAIKETLSL